MELLLIHMPNYELDWTRDGCRMDVQRLEPRVTLVWPSHGDLVRADSQTVYLGARCLVLYSVFPLRFL